jgi:hypothetical protein
MFVLLLLRLWYIGRSFYQHTSIRARQPVRRKLKEHAANRIDLVACPRIFGMRFLDWSSMRSSTCTCGMRLIVRYTATSPFSLLRHVLVA